MQRMSFEAKSLSSEYLRLYIMELFHRVLEEARVDEVEEIGTEYIEKVIAGFLLDF